MMMGRNTSFTITTTFSVNDLKIRTEHRTLFGTKRREVDFSAVHEVDFEIKSWGRYRNAHRASLALSTLDEGESPWAAAVCTGKTAFGPVPKYAGSVGRGSLMLK
jgi:hypothetical protein